MNNITTCLSKVTLRKLKSTFDIYTNQQSILEK